MLRKENAVVMPCPIAVRKNEVLYSMAALK
jgi:hypothetical protein